MQGVTVNDELSIRGIGAPANSSKREWSIGQLWHCLLEQVTDSPLRLLGHLGLLKWDATDGSSGGSHHVGVPWMLIANLDFAGLVGLEEEAFLDVEDDWQILVQRPLMWLELDVNQCPCCWAELLLEVEQLGRVGTSAKECLICVPSLPVRGGGALHIMMLNDQTNDFTLRRPSYKLHPQPLSLASCRNDRVACMSPPGTRSYEIALPSGELASKNTSWAEALELCCCRHLSLVWLPFGSSTHSETRKPLGGTGGHQHASVMVEGPEDGVFRPALNCLLAKDVIDFHLLLSIAVLAERNDFVDVTARRDRRWHGVNIEDCHIAVSSTCKMESSGRSPGPSSDDEERGRFRDRHDAEAFWQCCEGFVVVARDTRR